MGKDTRLETMDLYRAIAARTSLPVPTVRLVMDTFANITTHALGNNMSVVIRYFGSFFIKRKNTRWGPVNAVKFRPASDLKAFAKETSQLPEKEEEPMEKLGVELNNEAVLLAKVTGECPVCRSELVSKDPPNCPKCGTAPFEVKNGREEDSLQEV